jgi:hypothetical protein
MATLIPAIGSTAFDSSGERRLAERLEQKLIGGDTGYAEVGDGGGWGWWVWQEARIMTTESRHFICRNTSCAPL